VREATGRSTVMCVTSSVERKPGEEDPEGETHPRTEDWMDVALATRWRYL
jgi:hypothetical protein